MRDTDFILDRLINYIDENIQSFDARLVKGKMHIDEYNFMAGARHALSELTEYRKNELEKG